MYTPSYVVWVSPWHYWFYPPYWNPWTPWFYHHYYGYHYHWHNHYYGHYHHSHYYRSPAARTTYYGQRRSVSPIYASRKQAGEFKGRIQNLKAENWVLKPIKRMLVQEK
ncbi:MAG: hypothetical protein IPH89_04095 [Bacteroidetes bacterium]|nr:hypothetical protein [Bacteroidota bacterium]